MSKRSRQRQRHTQRLLARANGHETERVRALREAYAPEAPIIVSPPTEAEIVRAVGEIVERATDAESKQPRFSETVNALASNVFGSVYRFVKMNALKDEPRRDASMRAWDTWQREFFKQEPYLTGVLNSVIQIDKNRHYTITGGRNQVRRYVDVFQHARADAGTGGWRPYCAWQAQSFYTTRMGFLSELGRDGENGPLRALWAVDPCAAELTGNPEFPLRYFPQAQSLGFGLAAQNWGPQDYFRGASLASTDERMFGYGFPAIARAYDLAVIMTAVYEHDKEELGARAPRGLLLLRGISEAQWEDAMQARKETLDGLERAYFGGVATLASMGGEEISATLVALSQLPKGWSTTEWVNLYMYALALTFGYDPREFWPVSGGQLGTATETEVQHRKATSKGQEFSIAHQEQLQNQLPPSILFAYEQRDVEGEIADTQAQKVKAELITEITKWLVNGVTVLTQEQILQLAAQHGVIPDEWTPVEEDVSATDTNDLEIDRLRSLDYVQRAVEKYPEESIVRYESKTGRMVTLVQRAGDLLKRRAFPAARISRYELAAAQALLAAAVTPPAAEAAPPQAVYRYGDAAIPTLLRTTQSLTASDSLALAPVGSLDEMISEMFRTALEAHEAAKPPSEPRVVVNVPTPVVNVPAPIVNVNVPSPLAPQVRVAAPAQPNVIVNVPPQPAPVVNVAAPNVVPPDVNVQVNPTPVTVQNEVSLPAEGDAKYTLQKDSKGNLIGITKRVE